MYSRKSFGAISLWILYRQSMHFSFTFLDICTDFFYLHREELLSEKTKWRVPLISELLQSMGLTWQQRVRTHIQVVPFLFLGDSSVSLKALQNSKNYHQSDSFPCQKFSSDICRERWLGTSQTLNMVRVILTGVLVILYMIQAAGNQVFQEITFQLKNFSCLQHNTEVLSL